VCVKKIEIDANYISLCPTKFRLMQLRLYSKIIKYNESFYMSIKESKAIIVLGMHRSGTSAISGVFSHLGVLMGKKLFKAQKGVNERGFFENSLVVSLNERLFEKLESSWDDPLGAQKDIMKCDTTDEFIRAKQLLISEYDKAIYWGIKDPRTSVLLRFWQKVFDDLKITPHYLIMVRHPMDVFRSLEKRDKFSIEKSLILWVHYTLASFKDYHENSHSVMLYDSLMNDTENQIEICLEKYAPKLQSKVSDACSFISIGLRNHSAQSSEYISKDLICEIASSLYNCASESQINKQEIEAIETRFQSYLLGLNGVISEHLTVVKREEIIYRRLFGDAYNTIWWKFAWPLRLIERKFRRTKNINN
jgi:hypothetical protein